MQERIIIMLMPVRSRVTIHSNEIGVRSRPQAKLLTVLSQVSILEDAVGYLAITDSH